MAHIEEIAQHEGRSVTLRGWLHNRRSSGKLHFLTVRDGTGFIQAVMSKAAVGEEVFLQAGHLGQETAVVVAGEVRADARALNAGCKFKGEANDGRLVGSFDLLGHD